VFLIFLRENERERKEFGGREREWRGKMKILGFPGFYTCPVRFVFEPTGPVRFAGYGLGPKKTDPAFFLWDLLLLHLFSVDTPCFLVCETNPFFCRFRSRFFRYSYFFYCLFKFILLHFYFYLCIILLLLLSN
jgi:hypothetical protein